MEKITHSEKETFEFGREIARLGEVFLLYGELGAGKTVLVRGICAELGVPTEQIHSPTFAIVNEYEIMRNAGNAECRMQGMRNAENAENAGCRECGSRGNGGVVYHIDAYRLTAEQWVDGGFDEYLDNGVCLIEWAENLPEMDGIRIEIKGSGEESRCITVN